MSKIINIIKMSFNWVEKMIGISLILLFFLVLIKFLIRNETFAYTIVTLLIFVLSSQIATFIRSTWITDKYIFSQIVDIGEVIVINGIKGIVDAIGKDYFWIKIDKEYTIEHVRIPISDLNFQKISKIEIKKKKDIKVKIF